MKEDDFVLLLVEGLAPRLKPHKVERKRALLYDLSFDHRGTIAMGVDPDSGEPIRGHGRGFEQDILVFDDATHGDTSVVPRVVAEVKWGGVTTHDVIVYSEKADRIRRVYPYVRYGFVLGGMGRIPGRVLRLGQRFDFIASLSVDLSLDELERFYELMCRETQASETLTDVLFNNCSATVVQKCLLVEGPRRASKTRITS